MEEGRRQKDINEKRMVEGGWAKKKMGGKGGGEVGEVKSK